VEEKKPAPAPAAGAEEKGEVPVGELAGLLDIRVGRVVKAWLHPEADTLYVEEVDVGEEQPRTICSGLVKYLSLDQLQVIMHERFLIYSAYGMYK
jgi:tRNA-binding EMAP/Myf-like protein